MSEYVTDTEENLPGLTDSIITATTRTPKATTKDLPTTSLAWPPSENNSSGSQTSSTSVIHRGPTTRSGTRSFAGGDATTEDGDAMELDDSIG